MKFILGGIVAVAALMAVLWFAMGKRAKSVGMPAVVYPDLETFLAGSGESIRHQVVFIGMDGAAWDIIDPMIDDGELPTFARLKREGASGVLRSVPVHLSPPAWTTMFTGYSQQNTGIYTFGKWHRDKKSFSSVSSADVQVPFLWDVAGAAGKRVATTNIPMTYPARPVNGIMVTGLLTPFVYDREEKRLGLRFKQHNGSFHKPLDDRSFSSPLFTTATLVPNMLALVLYDTTDDGKVNHDTVAMKIVPQGTRWRDSPDAPTYTWSLNAYSDWAVFDYQRTSGDEVHPVQACMRVEYGQGTGRRARANFGMLHLSPFFRLPDDPAVQLTYPPELAAEIAEKFRSYVINLNVDPQMIVEKASDTAMFASFFYDHDDWDFFAYNFMATDNIQHREGFSPRTREVYKELDRFLAELIEKLPEDATLIVASDHGFEHYDYVVDLNNYFYSLGLIDNLDNPDYSRTLVFHNQWCLYFNDDLLTRDELEARDIPVGRKNPREALVNFLMKKVGEIEGPDGKGCPLELVDVGEDAAGLAPDMIVIGTKDDYFVEGPDMVSHRDHVVTPTTPDAPLYHDRGWFHDRDGIYIAWGKDIRQGFDVGTRPIEDMTPTILYLLGVPLAPDFDGSVMEEIVTDEAARRRSVSVVQNYSTLSPDVKTGDEDLQSHEEKLRSLGYIR